MQEWMPSFLDEMQKVAVSLTKREKRKQSLQFGALGLVAAPVIGSIVNMVAKGRPLPEGVTSVKRYLAASAVGGGLTLGAIPSIQHAMERQIQNEANKRIQRQKARSERKLRGFS